MPFNFMLQEICKASTMNAATALSKFLKIPLKIDIKPVEIKSIDNINLPYHSKEMTVSLFVPIKDHVVKGGSPLVLTKNSALAICDLVLNRTQGSTKQITEIEESALKELANIVLGNFLTPFAHSLLQGSLIHSQAAYEINTANEIIKHIRSLLAQTIGKGPVINIVFSYEHENIKGIINIVFEEGQINSLLKQVMVLSNG